MRRPRLAVLLTAALAVGAVASVPVSAGVGDPLGPDLDAILANPALRGADVGLVVRTADGSRTLYRRAGDRRQQPASTIKLVTSAAALELLGPDHRFATTVAAGGPSSGPVLRGDLYLRGTGDPTMLAKDYDALAARVAAAGIRFVQGKLVADDTWFDTSRLASGWAWDDEPYYYNAQVSALTAAPDTDFDTGSVIVKVAPAAPGAAPAVTTDPPTDYVKIANTAVTGTAGSPSTLSVGREHGGNTITVSGSIPAGAAPTSEWMAVWEPTDYAAALFRDALAAHGVRVLGPTTRGATPQSARRLAERRSMPLRELQVPFLKLSNNLVAEILVKSIGRKVSGVGSWDAGLAAIDTALPGLGVDPTTKYTVDGSGLSRMDNLSADALTSLLIAARGKPWFNEWYDALPIAGRPDRLVGGTLRNRMRGTPAEGNVHAKTGSYTGTSGLAGYVTAANGEHLVFAIIANNNLTASLRTIEDAVAVRLANYDGDQDIARPANVPAQRTEPRSRRADLECAWTKTC
ncbi:D-alanyl-D-alanine carboxypeptidase/D-alanyl-D-alanine-endopeptidase (penicillin-binding protein 4) [Herbihabitans rhizosphaerae]|uniref:D-alanyl-D-alanine carboxypeptidase/D-alanyl-D-alanine-endopeptidase (Penicillin-binding protein 4) n=1 Tax=Herbihabitans rhizosphaerae TaxID=1872711 RepID=A0A4Q7KDY8_9PSEU|nr:D-alanyl-D-alanine carboxypeptidase/D-alanyl-D-alanine-endopeptidase [Herbihabitans rhizosphaerae]RZS32454.1 D-alanyl-D-alanine carboxypeptidase/D-alanyl-D-alanine-endopeptidase (penicillin-binding protein 4) [Herbihabitans rhizosphaerae]